MASVGGLALLAFGLLLMFHAAFSVVEYKAYLLTVERVDHSLPLDVVFECLGGALLSFVGVLMWGTSLAPIDITHASRDKTIDTWEKRPSSFRVFAHRGAAL